MKKVLKKWKFYVKMISIRLIIKGMKEKICKTCRSSKLALFNQYCRMMLVIEKKKIPLIFSLFSSNNTSG